MNAQISNRKPRAHLSGDQKTLGGRSSNTSQTIAENMIIAANTRNKLDKNIRSNMDSSQESGNHVRLDLQAINSTANIIDSSAPLLKRKTQETRNHTNSLDNPSYKATVTRKYTDFNLGNPTQEFSIEDDTLHRIPGVQDANGRTGSLNDTSIDTEFGSSPTYSKLSGGGKFGRYITPYMDGGDYVQNPINDSG